jgi:ribosomal protein L28
MDLPVHQSWSVLWDVHQYTSKGCRRDKNISHSGGATSSTQWPNVPKVTAEFRKSLEFVSVTFNMAKSLTTGAVIVVMRRRTAAPKMKKVPTWWTGVVLAILKVGCDAEECWSLNTLNGQRIAHSYMTLTVF